MTRRFGALFLAAGMTLGIGIARAAEDVHSHATASHKTILIDGDRIDPSALTIGREDVLEFQNFAFNPIMVTFIEPKEQVDKILCHLINHEAGSAGKAPWLLFGWNHEHQLTAIIPPGRFASVCSLAPGQYTFVSKPAARAVGAPAGTTLGKKGTITVQ